MPEHVWMQVLGQSRCARQRRYAQLHRARSKRRSVTTDKQSLLVWWCERSARRQP